MAWKHIFLCGVVFALCAVVIRRYDKEIQTYAKSAISELLKLLSDDVSKPPRRFTGSGERIFTKEELASYKGKKKKVYLALMGKVYDVTKGRKYYGEDGGYSFFAGCDASRAYVSGDFTEDGLIDDISGLTYQDYIGLEDWMKFYERDYKYVGKLIGRYYDEKGQPTAYQKDTLTWIEAAHQEKEQSNQEKRIFPPCNTQWNAETKSGRVWCSARSGGISRDWIGVPRLFKAVGMDARCACIRDRGPPTHDMDTSPHQDVGDLNDPRLKLYENCPPTSDSCDYSKQ